MSKNRGKGSKKWRGFNKKFIRDAIDSFNRALVEEGMDYRLKMTKPEAASEKNKA